MPPRRKVGGHINLPLSVRPDIDTWFFQLSSYGIGATALIFCMMFIHIMEVDLFIISYGQVGGIICVLQTHFILKKITPNKTTVHNCQVWGHTSFLVLSCIKCCSVWFTSIQATNWQ